MDTVTLLIVFGFISLMYSTVFFFIERSQKRFFGFSFIALGYLLIAIGAVFMILQQAIPMQVSLTIANTLTVAGKMFVLIGLQFYFARRPVYTFAAVITFLACVLTILFTVVDNNATLRIGALSALLAIASAAIALLLWQNASKIRSIAVTLAAICFTFEAFFLVARAVVIGVFIPNPSLLAPNPALSISFFLMLAIHIIYSATIFMMFTIRMQSLVEETVNKLNESANSQNMLFSLISHDMKSTMFGLSNLMDLLKRRWDEYDNERKLSIITLMNTGSKRLALLMDNLFFWAESQRNQLYAMRTEFCLEEVVRECIELFEIPILEKMLIIETNVPDDLTINSDIRMVTAVLRNLISNAVKFSYQKGRIIVSAEVLSSSVYITVNDFGQGMTAETMTKLFNLETHLSTLGTENEKGSGLGLYLCKKILIGLDSDLTIRSEYGRGSQFSFKLNSVVKTK